MWTKQIKSSLGVAAVWALAGGVAQAELPASVSQALAQAQVPLEAVSVVVDEVGKSGATVLSHRANEARNPASVMKLVTTLAGMELLGPAWRWRTPVYVDGSVREGVLQGNLYIQGKGDPKLVSERIWLLLRRVQGLGIRQIHGDIVLDRSAFEVPSVDPGEFDGEPLRPYNAAPDALLLNYKSVVMTWVPDASGQQATLQVEPTLAGVNWPAGVSIREGACNDYRGGLKADFSDPTQPRFAGRYPSKCGEKVWPLAYADPASYNARVIEGLWRASGGQLQGKVREGRVPMGLAPAFEWESPPLAEVVRDINKFSSNVMAQQLFLTLSLQQRGVGTYAASREILREWWAQRLGGDEPRVANGSGLARDDRISATALARLLQYAWASPLMPELLNSLPLSGVDGTLRPERWRAGGSAHLKTGSLRDVNALAGIVDGAQGQRYVLVAVVNHANANAARPAMEALVDWIVKSKSSAANATEPARASHNKTNSKPKDKKP